MEIESEKPLLIFVSSVHSFATYYIAGAYKDLISQSVYLVQISDFGILRADACLYSQLLFI